MTGRAPLSLRFWGRRNLIYVAQSQLKNSAVQKHIHKGNFNSLLRLGNFVRQLEETIEEIAPVTAKTIKPLFKITVAGHIKYSNVGRKFSLATITRYVCKSILCRSPKSLFRFVLFFFRFVDVSARVIDIADLFIFVVFLVISYIYVFSPYRMCLSFSSS